MSNKHNKQKETKPTGEAPENLIWCYRCRAKQENNKTEYVYNNEFTEFPWAITIHCPNPDHSPWIVCTTCSFAKKRMTNKPQVTRHNKSFHNNNRNKLNIKRPRSTLQHSGNQNFNKRLKPTYQDNIVSTDENNIKIAIDTSNKRTTQEISKIKFDFGNEHSNNYFVNQHNNKGGSGYLVGLSQFHMHHVGYKLKKEEIDLDLSIASLCNSISHKERSEFAKVIKGVANFVETATINKMKKKQIFTFSLYYKTPNGCK